MPQLTGNLASNTNYMEHTISLLAQTFEISHEPLEGTSTALQCIIIHTSQKLKNDSSLRPLSAGINWNCSLYVHPAGSTTSSVYSKHNFSYRFWPKPKYSFYRFHALIHFLSLFCQSRRNPTFFTTCDCSRFYSVCTKNFNNRFPGLIKNDWEIHIMEMGR